MLEARGTKGAMVGSAEVREEESGGPPAQLILRLGQASHPILLPAKQPGGGLGDYMGLRGWGI